MLKGKQPVVGVQGGIGMAENGEYATFIPRFEGLFHFVLNDWFQVAGYNEM